MATTARLDLSAWRNDNVYEFPLRVRGADLTDAGLVMEIRLGPDTPGAPLVSLAKVTNGNAEGVRLAGVTIVDGLPESDVRIRINKTTLFGLPYAGERGDATELAYALLISGQTRLVGSFIILASTYGSDAAPASRSAGYTARSGVPASGALLTIAATEVTILNLDAADLIGPTLAAAADLVSDVQDQAQVSAIISEALIQAPAALPVDGNPNILTADVTNAGDGTKFDVLILKDNTGPGRLTAGGLDRGMVRDGGGTALAAGDLPFGKIAIFQYSAGGGNFVLSGTRDIVTESDPDPLAMLRPYLIDNPYGTVTNTGGTIAAAVREIGVQSVGSSIGNGFGGIAGDAPVDMFCTKFNARRRQAGVRAVADNRSVNGQAILDFAAQAAGSTATQPRKIKIYVPLMNDMFFRYLTMRHTFPLMQARMESYLDADADAGVLSVVLGSPHPNFRTVDLSSELPTDTPVSWPFFKPAPASAADIRNALGSDLTDPIDWTGSGILTRGVRTFAHGNTWLRDLCRRKPTAVFGDSDWAFRRFGLEPAVQQADPAAAVDALYMPGQFNHFSHSGYGVSYDRVVSRIADAILNGDLGNRYFRGDE